ncbi:MAG: hypothetical protein AAGE01_01805 [Pseudomonadota bacterium]
MSVPFHCWQCGQALTGMILPVSRREACRACNAEIHVCRMCVHFRANRMIACAEERAEDVSNRELANFCDYFAPNPGAWQGATETATDAARDQLEALFGGDTPEPAKPDDARQALDDLFKGANE